MEPCPRNPRYEHLVFTSITLLWDFENFSAIGVKFWIWEAIQIHSQMWEMLLGKRRGGGGRVKYNNSASAGWGIWQSVCSLFRDMEVTPFKWGPSNCLWFNPTGCKNWALSCTMNSMSSVFTLYLPSNYLSRSTREVTRWYNFQRLPGTPPPSSPFPPLPPPPRLLRSSKVVILGVLCLWMVHLVLFCLFSENFNFKACYYTPCLASFLGRIILIPWATNYCNCTAVCFMFLGACVG